MHAECVAAHDLRVGDTIEITITELDRREGLPAYVVIESCFVTAHLRKPG